MSKKVDKGKILRASVGSVSSGKSFVMTWTRIEAVHAILPFQNLGKGSKIVKNPLHMFGDDFWICLGYTTPFQDSKKIEDPEAASVRW